MKADELKLLEFIGQNKKTFNIPVYQRNYNWKKAHCERLFSDTVALIGNKKEAHFLGTIVYVIGETEANFSEFIVIDGQQRLTSVMLFLKALSDVTDDNELREEIYEEYLTNKRAPEKYRLKLKTIQSDCEVFKKIINNEEVSQYSNLKKNYNLFIELIIESNHNAREIYNAIIKLSIVYIQLDKNKENP